MNYLPYKIKDVASELALASKSENINYMRCLLSDIGKFILLETIKPLVRLDFLAVLKTDILAVSG